mgnify:CR=1 FL=1|tara:strand:+ start:16292 stop:16915 length:624 start_codon:yes stop_codon:yes gene_type:complete
MALYNINNDMLNPILLKKLIDELILNSNLNTLIKKSDIDYDFILKLLKTLEISLSKYEYSFFNNIKKNVTNTFKTKHSLYLNQAANYAKHSNLTHKHGCIIVYNDKIISWGHNKKHRSLKNFSIHAEIDAVNRLNRKYKNKKTIGKCSLYVVRIRNGVNEHCLKMSKPCMNCANKIHKIGIRTVYYSSDSEYVNDFIYTEILKNLKK